MRRTLLIALLAWPLATLGQTQSEYVGSGPFHTGRTLHGWCEQEKNEETLLCMGYLAGVSDALEGIAYNAGWGTSGVCRPKGTTVGKLRDAVLGWMEAHPGQDNKAGSIVVILALRDRFPCDAAARLQ